MEKPKYSTTKTNSHITRYALTDKWILAKKHGIPKTQFSDDMKGKKKEDHSVDTDIHLRRGNKTSMEGVTEIKFGGEMKGLTI